MINEYLRSGGRRKRVSEKIDCMEIIDNVFIGTNTVILYDVRIGENCIIGTESLVNKDIPPNSVAVCVSHKVIGEFEYFAGKRLKIAGEEHRFPASYTWRKCTNENC